MIKSGLFIGLMSGTSLDGIDCALVEIKDNNIRLVETTETPFPAKLHQQLIGLIQEPRISLQALGVIHKQLALCYAESVNLVLQQAKIAAEEIEAIGCHGQTLYHQPPSNEIAPAEAFSLQLGDPSTLAKLTNIPVAADFRQADIALGGQGAPLAPAFHHFLFHEQAPLGVLNLGGIANLTAIKHDGLIAYDTGPASTLMDAWIRREKGLHYDHNGDWAKQGHVQGELLAALLSHPFLKQAAPKSTGFETFNLRWLDEILSTLPLTISATDTQTTLAEFTAETVSSAIRLHQLNKVFVCGGGVHNGYLMQRVASLSGATVESTATLGIAPDWMEAMCFAWLAQRRLYELAGNEPDVTGASRKTILGGLFLP